MSYDERKSQNGQEFVQEIEIVLDACKYTAGEYLTKRVMAFKSAQTITDTDTGNFIVVNVPVGWVDLWGVGETIYGLAVTSFEIFSFEPVSTGVVNITGRGLFGTTADDLSAKIFTIYHAGEVDGTCRGFPHTCSNSDSYSADTKLRLIFSTGQNAGGVRRFPGLRKVSHDSCEVDPGESIGSRARIKFEISNQINNDYGIVPYPSKQTSSGTLFGKLLARHPYLEGREVIYREGLRGANTYSAPDFIERTFIIDDANLDNGLFSVTALDPLILTEDKKAKIPTASSATLSAAITGSPATFSFINAPSFYFGAMSAIVYVRIDSEVIKCSVSGSTQLTVLIRGFRSVTKDHSINSSIQDCVVFIASHGIDAIVFALENYTSISADYIDDYSAVIASMPAFDFSEMVISKPMSVSEFIDGIVKLGNLNVYFNEEDQKVAIEYTPELLIEPITIDQEIHIKRDSVQVDNNIKNQWTRFSYLFAPVDVTSDKEENFAIRFLSSNISLESAASMGQVNEKKTIKNGFVTDSTSDTLLVTSYVSRVLENNEISPKIITATLDASIVGIVGDGNLKPGSIINLSTKYNEDKDGNVTSDLYQVLKLSGDAFNGYKTKMRRYQALQPSTVDFVISLVAINYDLSDFYTPSAGHYIIYIDSTCEFGSFDTLIPAFTTGTQSGGVSFHLINRGRMFGMGGHGADCLLLDISPPGGPGEDGGCAFEATVDCTIDTGAGLIWAGGGGGSGEQQLGGMGVYLAARGGSGAQGYGISLGGHYTNGEHSAFDGLEQSGGQAGYGLSGRHGGAWGEPGELSTFFGFAGGSAGAAIKKNGNAVSVTAGDNALNIRGLIV